jgi:hypothetical protein
MQHVHDKTFAFQHVPQQVRDILAILDQQGRIETLDVRQCQLCAHRTDFRWQRSIVSISGLGNYAGFDGCESGVI